MDPTAATRFGLWSITGVLDSTTMVRWSYLKKNTDFYIARIIHYQMVLLFYYFIIYTN